MLRGEGERTSGIVVGENSPGCGGQSKGLKKKKSTVKYKGIQIRLERKT